MNSTRNWNIISHLYLLVRTGYAELTETSLRLRLFKPVQQLRLDSVAQPQPLELIFTSFLCQSGDFNVLVCCISNLDFVTRSQMVSRNTIC